MPTQSDELLTAQDQKSWREYRKKKVFLVTALSVRQDSILSYISCRTCRTLRGLASTAKDNLPHGALPAPSLRAVSLVQTEQPLLDMGRVDGKFVSDELRLKLTHDRILPGGRACGEEQERLFTDRLFLEDSRVE